MDARKISYEILSKIESDNAYVGELLDSALRQMAFSDKRDRALITRLVEGVTERRISLDFLIDRFSRKRLLDSRADRNIRCILRMGIYQIRYMDSIPDRAAVSEMVRLTKDVGYGGLGGYVNGLLRTIVRLKEEGKLDSYLVSKVDIRYSTPRWLCDMLVETYGRDTARQILEDQYREHDTVLRIITMRTSVDEYMKLLQDRGIEVTRGTLTDRALRIRGYDSVRRLPGYRDGYFIVQDETSIYTVERAGIKPGDRVLDMCSAPGGKSTLAYELATNDSQAGTIVSRDISESKLRQVQENAERLSIPYVMRDESSSGPYIPGMNIELRDATEPAEERVSGRDRFDVVLADVPCSGLGIIGRKNDIKYHITPEGMESLAEQGLIILSNAAGYVRDGGRICYSTCTICPGENGEVVRHFLAEHPEYSLVEERLFLQGVDGSDGFYYAILENIEASS